MDQKIKDKFKRDLSKQQQGEGLIALFCNVDVSPSMRLGFARDAAELGYTIEVFDLERLRSLLDGRFKDVRRRYLHIDDEIAERLRADAKKLLRFPAAFPDDQRDRGLLESHLVDQMPRRLFELLMRYDERDVIEVPELGSRLHEHMISYYQFRQNTQHIETEVLRRLPPLWNPPLPGALRIHARYSVLRFAGMTLAALSSGENFLNFGITWERAEAVFSQLAMDKSLVSKFEELLQIHARLSAGVEALASGMEPEERDGH